ncbi:DNA-binding anti-repressor SinI [Bacillus sp. APMAM]|nr:DNA-binding anti-repressor SinI [Bacillus sp. APMAM]RTZ55717.1 DNA-binding anti-repressor SinI [Bacillus sp. SAJ1]
MEKKLMASTQTLDQEWIDLILAALDMGISVQEIKDFFHKGCFRIDCCFLDHPIYGLV